MTTDRMPREATRIVGERRGAAGGGPGPDVMAARTLVGDRVLTMDGDDIGKVADIMLDVRSGRIAYAVVGSGGVRGLGDKLLAVPWNMLVLDVERKCFVLPVATEHVRDAPGFDRDRWPAMADPDWAGALHAYYGTAPYWLIEEGETALDSPPHEASPDGPENGKRQR
ncbi:MAG: PRC-barrel domain-containing protein [Burkholderia sp.]|uniref:PRC-barrel domain-containing protein n=2 Tax=Burkholderiaceae TaxID=119060 RepID=UPI001CF1DD7F|nr:MULTISPECIES: PRC-barrel domain-containing protein [Burkholderia]MCA3776480.1 PRC-barrel domain-containing protein [Burkholderia sp.]MCA3798877.1 PRC-barrel domain-containing protein [Burkholderia sp.]MCA3803756.1 PRC-barrel domain-containing protein [Burkholderia sp.]MCA3815014.1 PRC-barrel domain-containing protein [Burkholderia sp.]MCA3827182.1 PRC-barrel domain-containing protein [Burkholderia sp.]